MIRFIKYQFPYSFILGLFFLNTVYANEEFPGRKTYRNVPVITIDDLYKRKDKVTIVDTRSDYEYETLNIKDSVNIPLSSLDFSKKIKQLYKKENKTLVFYCNGHSCTKSYKAVIKTKRFAKITDSLAFDGGIFDWAHRHPDLSVLLGKSPINPKDLIPLKEFKRHLIKPTTFVEKASNNCIVLDVRDPAQRHDRIFPGNQKSISLSKSDQNKLNKYLSKAKKDNKPLCIYDAVGKQVRWLQYYLKQKKIKNYFFMEGGAKAFYDMS